ncbi:MAG: signal peptide peptidase SppA [Kiritimatiellae bacterium]|nr:signal peptide peptidase SppA [Kiritimatiellia bacterium]
MNTEKGCIIGCLGMVAVMGVIVAGIIAVLVLGVIAMDLGSDGDDTFGTARSEREKTSKKIWVCGEGDEDDPQILRVKIGGVISDVEEDLFGREKSSALSALKKIRAATYDEDIQGLYLLLDTPGGEVTLSDIIADAVQRFKKADKNRFVLVEMGSLCCSGGYYIAAGADYIIAHPTTITGSIGVIMGTINAAELAKKIGIESVVIATGTNKAMLDPLKPVDQEHVKIFQKAVDADYERFLSIVSKGRKIPVDKLRPIADGRILSAEEAKKLKLIDAIGYSEDAEAQLAKMADAEDIRIIRYKDEHTWRDLFDDTFLSSQGMGRALRRAATSARHTRLSFLAE